MMSISKKISIPLIILSVVLLIGATVFGMVFVPRITSEASALGGLYSYDLQNQCSIPFFGDGFDLMYNTWNVDNDGIPISPAFRSNFSSVNSTMSVVDYFDPYGYQQVFTATSSLSNSSDFSLGWNTSSNIVYPLPLGNNIDLSNYPFPVLALKNNTNSDFTGNTSGYILYLKYDLYLSEPILVSQSDDLFFLTYNLATFGNFNFSNFSVVLSGDMCYQPATLGSDPVWVHLDDLGASSSYSYSDSNSSNKCYGRTVSLPFGNRTINNFVYNGVSAYKITGVKIILNRSGYYSISANSSIYCGLVAQSMYYGFIPSFTPNYYNYLGIASFGYNMQYLQEHLIADASNNAYQNGYNAGNLYGNSVGYSTGYSTGYGTGYGEGLSAGIDIGNLEAGDVSWGGLFTSIFNTPVNVIFGRYDVSTGQRVGGLFNMTIPLGDTSLNFGNFVTGVLSFIVLLVLAKFAIRLFV